MPSKYMSGTRGLSHYHHTPSMPSCLHTPLAPRSLDLWECQDWIHHRTAELLDSLGARVLVCDTDNNLFRTMGVRGSGCMTLGGCVVLVMREGGLLPAAHPLTETWAQLRCMHGTDSMHAWAKRCKCACVCVIVWLGGWMDRWALGWLCLATGCAIGVSVTWAGLGP